MAVLSRLLPVIAATYGLQAVCGLVFIPLQTERFYDFCGSLGFLTAAGISLYGDALKAKFIDGAALPALTLDNFSPRQLMMTGALVVWATRLGAFLLHRSLKHGGDSRFDKIKTSALRFSFSWFMQANWIMIVGMPVYLINVLPKSQHTSLTNLDYVGLGLAAASFLVEVVADIQKSRWRAAKSAGQHSEKFISRGLWGLSRHPNYVGEIGIWTGIAIAALHTVRNAYPRAATFWALGSPLFTYSLLRFLSGVPPLERAAARKFGDDAAWKAYVQRVPVLWPWARK